MKEKWICPDLDVQVFTPQEYIAGCYRWYLDLECTGGSVNGDHYVFNATGQDGSAAIGQVIHAGHHDQRLYVVTDTPETPALTDPVVLNVLSSVGEFPGLMGNDQNTHGNPSGDRHWMQNKLGEYISGYAWIGTDSQLHFHAGDMVWILEHSGTGTGPNAS